MLKTMRQIFIVGMMVTLPMVASATMMCQQLFLQTSKEVAVNRMQDPEALAELSLQAITFEATEPLAVARETKEIILMMAQSRGLIISDKEVNEKGKLQLGMPIGNGFSIELKYESHSMEEPRYVLDHMDVLSPTGKIVLSSNPIDMHDVRKLARSKTNFEIEAYGVGLDVMAKIPTLISGGVLREIQEMSPKLELLPKDVIRQLSNEPTLALLKKKANRAYMKYYIKRYLVRGVFKTAFKIALWPLKGLALAGILYMSAHTFNGFGNSTIQNMMRPMQPTQSEWVYKSIQESVAGEGIPAAVKLQLTALEADLRTDSDTAANPVTENIALDQNAPKLQVARDQYMWTTNITDPATGKTASIIFVSSDNRHGQVNYTAIQVDPTKYAQLISYIKATGQFIPVTAADLK